MREGSSFGVNARVIKRRQAGVSRLWQKRKPGDSQVCGRPTNKDEDVPLSTVEVADTASVELSITPSFPPEGRLRELRTPNIIRISSLCSSTLSLSNLVCGASAPLLRVRSVLHRTLQLFKIVGG